jgi:hypothetical protein
MAINQLQLPQQGAINSAVDWSPLQNLATLINQQRQQADAANILARLYGNQQQPGAPPVVASGGDGTTTPAATPAQQPTYPPLSTTAQIAQLAQGGGSPTVTGTAADYLNPKVAGLPTGTGPIVGGPGGLQPSQPTQPPTPGSRYAGIPPMFGLPALARWIQGGGQAQAAPTQPAGPAPWTGGQGYPLAPFPEQAQAPAPAKTEQAATPTPVSASGAYTTEGLDRLAASIRKNESSGNYNNVTTTKNPRTGQTQSAIGAYGVMDFNVGPWTKEVLGHAMTPQQFLDDRNAQDAVAKAKLGQYADKYGLTGAARAWIGGPGGVTGNAADAFGTTPAAYAARVTRDMGLPPEITEGRSRAPAGIQVAQAGDITPDQIRQLALNPLTAPLAQTLIEQRISPKFIETGTDPLTGQKTFAQQIGNRLVPVNMEGGAGAAGGTSGLFDKLNQMQQQGASKEQMLAAIPAGYRNGVQALIEGRDIPANYGKANIKASMDMLAQIVDPNFNPSMIPARMQTRKAFMPGGKEGSMIVSYNTTQHHLEQASDALEVLAPLMSRFSTVNAMKSWINSKDGQQFPQYADAMTTLQTKLQATREEMSHVYNPGHIGESEQGQWNALLDPYQSPDKMRRNFYSFSNLMEGKRDALNDAYKEIFHEDAPLINRRAGEELKTKLTQRLPAHSPERQAMAAGVMPGAAGGTAGPKNVPFRILGQ